MTAIITDRLKKQILQAIIADVDSADNNYYIGIGRSEVWDSADAAPTPKNSGREIRNLGHGLQSVKVVADKSMVVPRYNWSSGAIYSGYNDNIEGHPAQAYYVFTDENHVYICLQQGRNAAGTAVTSTVKPTGTSSKAFKTSDGYIWKFLYSIGALTAAKFLAANFLPVTKILTTDGSSTASEVEQKGIQDSAVAGQIIGYTVTEGGTGYTSTPTVTITGNGTGAKAVATVSGGAVSKIEVKESDSTLVFGQDYQYASISLTGGGGTGVKARPIFGPRDGIGADPRDDLRARAIMFNAKPDGTEEGDFVIGQDFRQVALIKNPKGHADSDMTDTTLRALPSLTFSTVSTAFTRDKIIRGGTSLAEAYVDDIDSSGDVIYYHQTETTGFTQFQEGEAVTETNGSGSGTLEAAGDDADDDAYVNGEFDPLTGEVLYIDNRAAVSRSAEQTEDIKIVIQI